MRKRVLPRIVWFLLLYCIVFFLLVLMQFTHRGNFSQRVGDMVINGRHAPEAVSERTVSERTLDGKANVVYGGLEFRLSLIPGTDTGFSLVDAQGRRQQTSPEYITTTENEAIFTLPGGTELSFASQNAGAGSELRISGKFSDDVSAMYIPFRAQRSSVIRGNGNDTLIISYNGNRYQFSRPLSGPEAGQLVLSAAAPVISYRVVTDKKEFNPADFIVPQAQTAHAFTEEVSRWIAHNFALWGPDMSVETDEDTVIAWCGEAVRRGNYQSAVSAVPVSFSSSPLRTWESAVYQFDRRIGVWENAVRTIAASEREKRSRISRLLEEKNYRLFAEEQLITFLEIRGQYNVLDSLISFVQVMNPSAITLDISSGIVESWLEMHKQQPQTVNPFDPLVEQVCQLVAGGIRYIEERVFVFSDGHADIATNLRLGLALSEWGEKSGRDDWAGLGRSLVFSVISLGDRHGSVAASLTSSGHASGHISSAKLYRLLGSSEYLPHWTATGTDGIWAYTAASSVNVVRDERQMDIAIHFPVGTTHYVMLRNIAPFPLLQIYDMNWRRASDFESYYNSSGWYYFEQEQILVIKISHRSNVETIRILFTVPAVETPPPQSSPQTPTATAAQEGQAMPERQEQ